MTTPIQGSPSDSFLRFNDQDGNLLVALHKDGTVSTEGVRFSDGTEQMTAGGSGIVLQTNGTPNVDQALLNVAGGSGITATDNGAGTVTLSATGAGTLTKASGTLSSAQIQALAVTPITLVAAPGAGKYLLPWYFTMEYVFNTAPYSVSGNLDLVGGTEAIWAQFDNVGFTDQSVNVLGPNNSVGGAPIPSSQVANQPLTILSDSDALTGGSGTINWVLYYTTETIS